ncbi:TB2/DP1, HVA22 family protein [Nitzschia inconspicua]|uniref:TB2/DP1, HVA22 family protein n=1 Tax=Nitzschia inconspicua TaxID=303405 RepID=A0A9K3PNE2_9STRA|nr:TB2/DP1, HVA22 family protein [Nitzschia inconspicua]
MSTQDKIIAEVQKNLAVVRAKLDQVPILQEVEDKTKIPKEYFVPGATILFGIFVFFGIGASTLCAIIGFLYPAYQTLVAIENKNKGDDIQWIVYWVLYTFFSLIETFQDFILYWIPFYFAFKLALLLWAMLPQTRGAKFLYDNFLKDFLKKTGDEPSRLDVAMSQAKLGVDTTAEALASNIGDLTGSKKFE